MPSASPELSICVLHYNRWDLTEPCLQSIDAQEIPCTYEKLLIDNGSDVAPSAIPGWDIRSQSPNVGHIAGQNRCFQEAKGKWVLFVANDVRMLPDCIKYLWIFGKGYIAQPTLLTPDRILDNRGLDWHWPGYGISTASEFPNAFSSTCYLMSKRAWEETGGFDERLVSSHEDIDFSLRARNLHWGIRSFKESIAIHLGNATLRHQPSHNRKAFHRDRCYILRKHYRGLDWLLRSLVVHVLDAIPRF